MQAYGTVWRLGMLWPVVVAEVVAWVWIVGLVMVVLEVTERMTTAQQYDDL